LSYSHQDSRWAGWLHRALENYRIPSRIAATRSATELRLKPIFRDRDELASAADLSATIRDALAESEYLIVICSRQAAQSRWVNQEIEEFIRLGRMGKILCFALDDPSECRPAALSDVESLAADVRPEADGRNGAKLKLIAGLLGLRYDDLVQRDAARRQRRLATIAALALAGIALTSGLAIYATVQRQNAIAERLRAEAINDYLVQEMLGAPDPAVDGTEVKVVDVLDRAAAGLETAFAGQPELEADLRFTLAVTYRGLGLYERSEAQAAAAHELRTELYGPDHLETLLALDRLGRAQFHLDRNDQAIETLTTAADGIVRDLGPDARASLEARAALAGAYARSGDYRTAATIQSEILAKRRAIYGELDKETIEETINLANIRSNLGETDAAQQLFLDVLEGLAKTGRDDDQAGILALTGLSLVHSDRGEYDMAEDYARRALASATRVYGEDHPETIGMRSNLANAIRFDGRYAEALPILREVLAQLRAQLGDQNQVTMAAAHDVAGTLVRMGQHEEAERIHRENLDNRRRAMGPRSLSVASTLGGLGIVYSNTDRWTEAIESLTEALAILRDKVGDGHPEYATTLSNIARAYERSGDFQSAALALRELVVIDTRAVGATHRWVMNDYRSLIEVLVRVDAEEAESFARERLEITNEHFADDDPIHLESMALLGMTLSEQRKFSEAESLVVPAYEALSDSVGMEDRRTNDALAYVIRLYQLMERPEVVEKYQALTDQREAE
ncbi:MAG: toll/interleukin-1 receptor domain-containing protein, partial [Xanthomonadales bacterium]|nr:toll/interleukin-1 receptor domain-containing protein [Xanthomonadales bacterium]